MQAIYEEVRVALHNIWRHRWLALAIAWAVAVLGWLSISTVPNRYESKASVFVQPQQLLSGKMGISPVEQQKLVETIQRTLLAADNLEKVIRSTVLGRNITTPRQMADAVAGLRGSIEVEAQQDSMFEIAASSGSAGLSNAQNAKLSKDIVQKLLDLFVEGNLSGGRVETSQALKFLDQQLLVREQQMRETESNRIAFEQKHLGILPGPGGSISQRMEAARTELNSLQGNLMAAQSALVALNGQMASTPQSISTPGTLIPGSFNGAAARAQALESQLADAQAKGWTDSHPDMAALRGQLDRARAAAAREGDGGARMSSGSSSPNPMYVTLRSMQAEKQATVFALSSRRAQIQNELAQFAGKQIEEPGLVAEQQRLNRDYESAKAQYDKLMADREEVSLRGSVQTTTNAMQSKVISPPLAPRSPVAPNRPLLLTLALLTALAAGLGGAFGISQIKATYPSAGRLAKASGLPVLGSISEFLPYNQQSDANMKLRYFVGCSAALVGAWVLLLTLEFVQRSGVA